MTHKTLSKSLVMAALLGIGAIVAPSLAGASEAAKIQPADPALITAYSGTMPLLASSGGVVVTGNAWCDAISGVCEVHPWAHHERR